MGSNLRVTMNDNSSGQVCSSDLSVSIENWTLPTSDTGCWRSTGL